MHLVVRATARQELIASPGIRALTVPLGLAPTTLPDRVSWVERCHGRDWLRVVGRPSEMVVEKTRVIWRGDASDFELVSRVGFDGPAQVDVTTLFSAPPAGIEVVVAGQQLAADLERVAGVAAPSLVSIREARRLRRLLMPLVPGAIRAGGSRETINRMVKSRFATP